MDNIRELLIEAKVENLETVLEFVSQNLDESNFQMKERMQICVAVEEIFVNISNYAYNPETGGAIIRISVGNEVIVEFEDGGKPYNPLEKEDPDITLNAQQRDIGGLGIYMVKNIMDVVEYKHENGKNILTIRKYCSLPQR